jgi:hypothetical protein
MRKNYKVKSGHSNEHSKDCNYLVYTGTQRGEQKNYEQRTNRRPIRRIKIPVGWLEHEIK